MLKTTDHYKEIKYFEQKYFRTHFSLTPHIVLISDRTLTDIDFRNYIDSGLRVVRFNTSAIACPDLAKLLAFLNEAISWCCEKHEIGYWPIAVSVDLLNACILTGYLKNDKLKIYLPEKRQVLITSDINYWNKCDENKIFINDPHTLATLKINAEISINFGEIVLICTKVTSENSIKCNVIHGGYLQSAQFVCIRGVKLLRPILTKRDRDLLEFVKQYEIDIITIHTVRFPKVISKVREIFSDNQMHPLILCIICEQQGLDNIDSIIECADGIILARKFLAEALTNPYRLAAIQMNIAAKCRKHGKPFYISGNVLENTLNDGTVQGYELSDVTNAVMQAAGFVMEVVNVANNLIAAMELLNELSAVKVLSLGDAYWTTFTEPPLTTADASVLSCALAVKQTGSEVVIVLTMTGQTSVLLSRMTPQAAILSVTSHARVARRLQLYRGIISMVYQETKPKDWYTDMNKRIHLAVNYAIKNEILQRNQMYVVFCRGTPVSAFCDEVSIKKATVLQTDKQELVCEDF